MREIHQWQVGYSGSNDGRPEALTSPPDWVYPVPAGYEAVGPWEPFATQTQNIPPATHPVMPVYPYHLIVWRRPLARAGGGA